MMGVVAECLEAASRGAMMPADFDAWVAAEQKRVFLLCHRMLQDWDDADAATQDVFLKAYRALERRPEPEDRARWLTRIAVNTCLDRLRNRRWQFWRRRAANQETILTLAPSHAPGADELVFARQIEARLHQALGRLSDRQRAVFTLRHFDDHRLEEIGDILGLDTGTVKAHLARAIVKLRNELRDLYQVGPRAERHL